MEVRVLSSAPTQYPAMELKQNPNRGNYWIEHYDAGTLRINQQDYHHSIILSPRQLIAWPPQNLAALEAAHFDAIAALKPEIILIGTGEQQRFLAHELLVPFLEQQIGVEVMATAAACRTFNLLSSEGRNVVAGLLIT